MVALRRVLRVLCCGWVLLSAAALVRADAPIARPEQFGARWALPGVVSGRTPHRILHFTFDDGPHAEQTPRLLDALDRFDVRATFFFSASRFASAERRNGRAAELAQEVARRGHFIGSHSFEHTRMAKLARPALRRQLGQSEAAFERVFGARTHLFRPPHGSRNRALDAMLAEGHYSTVMWNVGLADWVQRPAERVRETFFKVLARNEREGDRGGIVLLHDTHPWSVDAFVLIMQSLRQRNCELLAAGEELYDVVDSLQPFIAPPDAQLDAARARQLRARTTERCGIER